MHNAALDHDSAVASGDTATAWRPSHVHRVPESPIYTSHHALVLFPGMEPLLRAIASDVAAARERIWIETYIFRADRLGRAFAETLARAARRGLEVRLLYDPLGCNETPPGFFDALRARGIDARPYRPRSVQWRTLKWWPRDHARNIVVDRASGYTGGAAWGDEWLPRRYGGHGWHDVCARVEGPAVDDFARAFEMRWAEASGEVPATRSHTTGGRYPDLEFVADSPEGPALVARHYRDAIRRARRRVWIENSYFLAPGAILAELYAAARRGVDVKIILPGATDLPLVKRAARAEYADWLDHGLKVYEYGHSIVHSKFAVVDDDWSTVGTYNVNVFSTRWSNELNLFVYDPAFVARAAALFANDVRLSEPVTHAMVARRSLREQVSDRTAHAILALLEPSRDPLALEGEPEFGQLGVHVPAAAQSGGPL